MQITFLTSLSDSSDTISKPNYYYGDDYVSGIGADGTVLGNSSQHAIVWENETPYLLWVKGYAYGANAAGEVVGVQTSGTSEQAVSWQNGQLTLLPSGGQESAASSVNDLGVVAGNAMNADGAFEAAVWQNGQVTYLGTLAGDSFSSALAINDAGQIVGTSGTDSSLAGFLWQNGQMTALATITGDVAIPVAINNHGEIAGYVTPAATIEQGGTVAEQAVIWSGGQIALLPVLKGDNFSKVEGINDAGIATGYCGVFDPAGALTEPDTAVIWQNGQIIDLNSLLPANSGWVLQQAYGISNANQIAGQGLYDGLYANFVLTLGSGTPEIGSSASLALTASRTGETVVDSVSDVTASLSYLETAAVSGKVTSIALTDAGTPTITVTALQSDNDAAALKAISSDFVLHITANEGDIVDGVPGRGAIVSISVDAAVYDVSGSGDTFVLNASNTTTLPIAPPTLLHNVTALQFTDFTEIVAQTPGSGSAPTSGNITELYGAIFGREPDVAGLAYYEAYLTANPNTPLLQFAEWFLASPEYTGASAHNYAQTVAGDEQFISDSYANLLRRTPSAAEVSFYESKVIAPMLSGLTAGTTAYAAADAAAHAQTLVYFSASQEFLSDAQVTATSPASTQHWLVLV
jgi:probable HAF family extracellular repeat protein